jgi:uncharacterized membrane protein
MERMLVVVFDSETKAYEGQSALRQLEREGSISAYAGAVVVKNADGTTTVKELDDFGPVGGLVGTSVGGLIGLLGGPAGLAIGAASGLALGAAFDLHDARVGVDFVDEVSKSLKPTTVALIAEIEEDWTTPVDTRMEALGGTVLRRALWDVQEDVREKDIAAMKADLAQLKDEISKAHAGRRAKLQSRIDQLQSRIDAQQEKAKERREAFRARQESKRAILEKNAAAAGRALKDLANTRL